MLVKSSLVRSRRTTDRKRFELVHCPQWLYKVVMDAVDGFEEEVVEDLEGKIAKCHANIGWLRVIDPV